MERNKEKSLVCDCENCQIPSYRSYHGHFFLRWVLGLIILGLVFIVGFKIGEFKQMFDDLGLGYGHEAYYMQKGYLSPMMNITTQSAVPSASAGKTTTK